jgi:hypothetical protein
MAGRTDDDGDDAPSNPGGQFADQGDAENGKAKERRSPEGGLHRQDPQEIADRMTSGGRDMTDKPH